MSLICQMKKDRADFLKQLRSTKEIIEEHHGWLSREGENKIGIRLVDLTSVLSKPYPSIEEYAPIEEAISYIAGGDDLILELIDCAVGEDVPEPEAQILRDKILDGMRELKFDLEEIPGFVLEEYRPFDNNSYYFLGINSQGKGTFAIVDESIKSPESGEAPTKEVPF